jgi:hypothetical protein
MSWWVVVNLPAARELPKHLIIIYEKSIFVSISIPMENLTLQCL